MSSRILLADDSESVRASLTAVLRRAGYEVISVGDGFEALAGLIEHQPALVLLDAQMPRLDGFRCCALIRRHAVFGRLPIVIMSGDDKITDRAMGRLAGCDVQLAKSADGVGLQREIEALLQDASPVTTEPARDVESEVLCPV